MKGITAKEWFKERIDRRKHEDRYLCAPYTISKNKRRGLNEQWRGRGLSAFGGAACGAGFRSCGDRRGLNERWRGRGLSAFGGAVCGAGFRSCRGRRGLRPSNYCRMVFAIGIRSATTTEPVDVAAALRAAYASRFPMRATLK